MYQKTILENGIRVLTENIPGVRSVSIGCLLDVGLYDEPPSKNGIAHLSEHLMFQGTANRDAAEIYRLMDAAGGNIGAFTSRDFTCYHGTVLDDFRTYVFELLGDILLNANFPANHLDLERLAVLREIDADRDSPTNRLNTLLKGHVWPQHPLGRPVLGNRETVRSFNREDVMCFVFKNYHPGRMIIAAAGNVTHEDILSQVRDAFWELKPRAAGGVEAAPDPGHHAGFLFEDMPVSQAYFALGLPLPSYTAPLRYELNLVNKILGGGVSSRLFRRLREEMGLVYQIGTEYHAYRQTGLLVVEGSTAPESLQTAITAILSELGKLALGDQPIDEEELWKAKRQLHAQHLIESEHSYTRMSRLCTQELYFGHFIPSAEIIRHIEEVHLDSLRQTAAAWLGNGLRQLALAVVGPEPRVAANTPALTSLLADYQNL